MSSVTIVEGGTTTVTEYEYNADGIRVKQTVSVDGGPVKVTEFLNDPSNHTGYSQVIQETESEAGVITKRTIYTIGHDQISQTVIEYSGGIADNDNATTHYFGYDGHGSTRVLLDFVGAVAEIYHFDAYGVALGFEPATALTSILYSGETFDASTGLQYLRARYYNPATGTFNRLDPFAGSINDPQSLHKYLYTHGDPISGVDPSGEFTISVTLGSLSIRLNVSSYAIVTATSYFIDKSVSAAWLLVTDHNLQRFHWFEWWDLLNLIPVQRGQSLQGYHWQSSRRFQEKALLESTLPNKVTLESRRHSRERFQTGLERCQTE